MSKEDTTELNKPRTDAFFVERDWRNQHEPQLGVLWLVERFLNVWTLSIHLQAYFDWRVKYMSRLFQLLTHLIPASNFSNTNQTFGGDINSGQRIFEIKATFEAYGLILERHFNLFIRFRLKFWIPEINNGFADNDHKLIL